MKDLLILLILAVILFCAARYVYKAKKRGQACIGCPHSSQCAEQRKQSAEGSADSGSCGCGCGK